MYICTYIHTLHIPMISLFWIILDDEIKSIIIPSLPCLPCPIQALIPSTGTEKDPGEVDALLLSQRQKAWPPGPNAVVAMGFMGS